MGNDFFSFKKFTVHQSGSAMKVSTDACIQGAMCVSILRSNGYQSFSKLLDIGAGTGLLSLMLHQGLEIEHSIGIEIDEKAIQDAERNAAAAPWNKKMKWIHSDVNNFESEDRYDLIISNPPFFQNSLHNPSPQKITARHNSALTLQQLSAILTRLLSPQGIASIMLPVNEYTTFENIVIGSLYAIKRISIFPTQHKNPNRIIAFLSKKENMILNGKEDFVIYNSDKSMSKEMQILMKDYYLHL